MAYKDKSDDSNFFWQNKYKKDVRYAEQLTDITDAYANELKMVISFQHVPTGKTVFFKAFITDYSESFTSGWQGEKAFGRTDPIYRYSGTERKIKLSFDVPASSESEAYENMGRIQRLVQFQYPSYFRSKDGLDEYTIGQSPLVRIKALNLIARNFSGAPTADKGTKFGTTNIRKAKFNNYRSSPLPEGGLVAAINSLNYNIEIGKAPVFEKAANTVLPQIYKVTVDFSVIHEYTIGWDDHDDPITLRFPYGADMDRTTDPVAVDASYAQRIQRERSNQAAADNAKSRFGGAFGKLRRKKAYKRGQKEGASDYDRALAEQAQQSLMDETGQSANEAWPDKNAPGVWD